MNAASTTQPPIRPGRPRATASATTAPDARMRISSIAVVRLSCWPPFATKAAAANAAPRRALAANEAERGTGDGGPAAPRGESAADGAQAREQRDGDDQRGRKLVRRAGHVVEPAGCRGDRSSAGHDRRPAVLGLLGLGPQRRDVGGRAARRTGL